ncbi:hypothetical protein HOY82DRAFT_595083 [Tuber indicum]|nr:hypothetical protein HOY82DRAFT_595083 [Tuber indicum]
MPRISEKVQLTNQLQDIWLSNVIATILFTENDFEFLYECLIGSKRDQLGAREQIIATAMRSTTDVTDIMFGIGENTVSNLEVCESILDEEVMEGLELLGLVLPAIRYLAPREAIPRCEYLFNYHIHTMSDDRFISFFRMTQETFYSLVTIISDDPIFHNHSHNPQAAPLIQLATALYLLGLHGSSTV